MAVEADTSGLGALSAKLEKLADAQRGKLQRAAQQSAERIVAAAKGNVYQNGLHYVDGMIRDSLEPVVSADEDSISVGVKTDLDIAVYHELGTGPVGTAAGYPGDAYLDKPVVRRSDGWAYYSEGVAQKRAAEAGEGEAKNGFVYTRGVPPKAFMHTGLMQTKNGVTRALQAALMEEDGD